MDSLKTNLLKNLKKYSLVGPVEKFAKSLNTVRKEGFNGVTQEVRMQVYREMIMVLFYIVLIAYCVMDINNRQIGVGAYAVAIFFPHLYIVFTFLADLMSSNNVNVEAATGETKYSVDDFSATSELFLGETPQN